MSGVVLLLLQAILYFGVMAGLFRARGALGIGVFVCGLGVMHFLETYLAAVFFIELPFGLISPGSVVLFSGKLAMLLLLYVKEDAEAVRQPVYGLLFGNLLVVAMCVILRFHTPFLVGGQAPDIGFVDTMGVLMIWGTLLLFVDAIMLVLLYERVARWFGRHHTARIVFCLALVLSFDQVAFFSVLRILTGAPASALAGGWVAKLAAAGVYGGMLGFYLHRFERRGDAGAPRRLADLFDLLTYRRQAVAKGGLERDPGSGALAARDLMAVGTARFRQARARSQPMAVMVVALAVPRGREALPLREAAEALSRLLRADDLVFRHGAAGFALLLDGIRPQAARSVAGNLARMLPERVLPDEPRTQLPELEVRVGVAPGPTGAEDFEALLRMAEEDLLRGDGEVLRFPQARGA